MENTFELSNGVRLFLQRDYDGSVNLMAENDVEEAFLIKLSVNEENLVEAMAYAFVNIGGDLPIAVQGEDETLLIDSEFPL